MNPSSDATQLPPPSADEAAPTPTSWAARMSLGNALALGAAAFVALVLLSTLLDFVREWLGF